MKIAAFFIGRSGLSGAAESLARHELIKYLRGNLPPVPQTSDLGDYRKMGLAELTLSSTDNRERIKWLCGVFGSVGWLSYRSQSDKRYFVSHFVSELETRAAEAERCRPIIQSRLMSRTAESKWLDLETGLAWLELFVIGKR